MVIFPVHQKKPDQQVQLSNNQKFTFIWPWTLVFLLFSYPGFSQQQIFTDGFECVPFTVCDTPVVEIFCGSGEIPGILSAEPVVLKPEDMIHVLILPEGYLQDELSIFHKDANDWLSEWENLDPYSTFRDAFCIWMWPLASKEHVSSGSPQTSDTAFLVPISTDGRSIDSDIPLSGHTAQKVWGVIRDFPFIPASFYPPGGLTSRIAKNLVPVILVYDPIKGASGFFGRSRRLQNPDNEFQRLSTAFAHNRPHEFSHALSRLQDEYVETCCGPLCVDNALAIDSANVLNVACQSACPTLPWNHLLPGGLINTNVGQLEGAFGVSTVGYHPELKCLMNGTHDNSEVFGGDGNLRVHDRFCNFCRELTVFRIFERIHVLDDPINSYTTWVTNYRSQYYDRFGFAVPAPIPQENSLGDPIFQACTDVVTVNQATDSPIGPGILCDIPDHD